MAEAKDFLNEASRLSSGDEALVELAQLGPVEQRSIEVAKEAVERNLYNAKSQSALGRLYLRDGDVARALSHGQESFRLYPLDPKVAKLLVDCYQASGQTDLAIEMQAEWSRLRSLESMQRKIRAQ